MSSIYQPYFKNIELPLSELEIEVFETDLGIKIPKQLRDFYLFADGAELIKLHLIMSNDIEDGVVAIDALSTMVMIYKTAEVNFDFFGEILELSDILFPLSLTSSNRTLYIVHLGENMGKIYISEEKDEDRNFIPVRLIANSFLEFLDIME